MTAAQTAQRLGLDAKAIAAFTGDAAAFAQHFGVAESEAPAAAPVVQPAVGQPATGGTVAPAPAPTTKSAGTSSPSS
jgi:hypothetical protein